jgi:hypothetical protein
VNCRKFRILRAIHAPGCFRKPQVSSSNLEVGSNDGPGAGPPLQECKAAPATVDAVEAALADAISKATAAGKFDVVSQLCRELEARRLGRLGNVVAIDSKRKGGAK